MGDARQNETTPSRGSLLLWAIPLVLCAYLLSPGPVIKALNTWLPTHRARVVDAIYGPLEYLDANTTAVHRFYQWYFAVWGIH